MADKLTDIEDEKSVNIALATGIFVVVVLTFIQLLGELIRIYIPSFTPWMEKLVLMILLSFSLWMVIRNHEQVVRIERFLLSLPKKGK